MNKIEISLITLVSTLAFYIIKWTLISFIAVIHLIVIRELLREKIYERQQNIECFIVFNRVVCLLNKVKCRFRIFKLSPKRKIIQTPSAIFLMTALIVKYKFVSFQNHKIVIFARLGLRSDPYLFHLINDRKTVDTAKQK